jgi:hypothetical protein
VKLWSFKKPIFETYWTYVKKPVGVVKQAERKFECQNPNLEGNSKSGTRLSLTRKRVGGVALDVEGSRCWVNRSPGQLALAAQAQQRDRKQTTIQNISETTVKPTKTPGFRPKISKMQR